MNYKEEVCKRLDITVTDEPGQDLNVYTTETADNYMLYICSDDPEGVKFTIIEEVFYYDDGLFSHLRDTLPDLNAGTTIYCSDEEELMPDWLWEEIYEDITKED